MRFMFVAAAALALCGPALAHPGHAPAAAPARTAPETLDLALPSGRMLPLTIWNGGDAGPVVIFLHGMGGAPTAYSALFARWTGQGITVVAPTEPDSHANPNFAKIDLPTGFGMRTEDLMATRGYVAQRYPGRALFLGGHSYGSLFAMMGGGAVTAAGPLSGPPVAGIVAFSTPGKIQGVVQPASFASVKVPMLLFTGTEDVVPGFVPNAADHRFAFDTAAAGDKMLVTFQRGTHDLIARPGKPFDVAAALSARFIDAYARGDARAEAAVRALPSTTDTVVEVR